MANILSIFERKPRTVDLVHFTNRFAHRSRKGRDYKRRYFSFARKLKAYEQHRGITLTSDSFNYQTTEDVLFFLRDLFPYRTASLISFMGCVSNILNRASREGYTVDWGFKDMQLKREETTAVYLCMEEIERINALTALSDEAKRVRDRFLLGCCTGLRYSDYSRLTIESIIGEAFHLKTRKTGVKVIIPVHKIVRDVMFRNSGTLPEIKCSQQAFNATIKRVCRTAGITEKILVERTEGDQITRKKHKKYELVASHTARRSFATNLYIAGVATAKIMLLTGHTTEQSFFKYIRISKEENASDLSTHPFFTCK